MLFRVLTIFPELITQYMKTGVLGRAQAKKVITVSAHTPREWTTDRHQTVDDTPYGGGAGMVMKAEPIVKAITDLQKKPRFAKQKQRVILLTPTGKRWSQALARSYAKKYDSLIFICGRYEGIDERVNALVDEKISVGDFVLTGGELAALAMMDSIARLVPGVLGNTESLSMESHSEVGLLEYPHYTKPEVIMINKKKRRVPKVLLSGNHEAIRKWREGKMRSTKSTTPPPSR